MRKVHSRKARVLAAATAASIFWAAYVSAGEIKAPQVILDAPGHLADNKDVVQRVTAGAAEELYKRFGLTLPPAITVMLTGSEEVNRIASASGNVRYDGVALAYENTVAVDANSGSIVIMLTVLRHEITHIATAPLNIPRWFDEGMAMYFSGNLFPIIAPPQNMANLTRVTPPVSGLNRLFTSANSADVQRAYYDSYLIVSEAAEILGDEKLKKFFAVRRESPGEQFEAQFLAVTGLDLNQLYRKIDAARKPGLFGKLWEFLSTIPLFVYLALIFVVGGIIKRKRLKEILMREDDTRWE